MVHLSDAQLSELLLKLNRTCDIEEMPIRGFVRNIQAGILPYEVHVDNWPEYSTVLAKPCDNDIQSLPVCRLGIYSNDAGHLEELLNENHELLSSQTVRIYGLLVELIPVIENLAQQLNLQVTFLSKEEPRNITELHFQPESTQTIRQVIVSALPENMYLTRLSPHSHLDMIVSTWKSHNWQDFYSTDREGRRATQYYLTHCLSVGAFRREDGYCAGWVMCDIDGSIIFGLTQPEYRKSTVTFCINSEIALQLARQGREYWGYLATGNTRSRKSLTHGNAVIYDGTDFVHCIIRPPIAKL